MLRCCPWLAMQGLAAAPPQACDNAIVVGDLRVPICDVNLLCADGNHRSVQLLELGHCGGHYLWKWLFKPMGVAQSDFRAGAPWRLPLFQEFRKAIFPDTLKRSRSGTRLGLDAEGNPRPMLLDITVRGRPMQAHRSRINLQVGLLDRDGINWLLAEVWKDLKNAPGFTPPLASQRGERCIPQPFIDAINPGIDALREMKIANSVHLDKTYGRIRMVVSQKPLKVTYLRIPRWRRLISELSEDEDHEELEDLARWVGGIMAEEAGEKLRAIA